MRAVLIERFGTRPVVAEVPDPVCPPDGVVVAVEATGLCRSDWHGWMGHDDGIALPHVPGHELAGRVVERGPLVRGWRVGDRVTTPFVLACGECGTCAAGHGQVCEDQRQPGFTGWGSFAGLVALPRADRNLVRIPQGLSAEQAAALGCRFATAYRAVVELAGVRAGQTVVVHGCGGVGLSAVLIAAGYGARVVAVDVERASLELADRLGAAVTMDGGLVDVPGVVRELTDGRGADVSIEAVGTAELVRTSMACLAPRGIHVQVGLLGGADVDPAVPMGAVIGRELQVLGCHGLAASSYPALLAELDGGRIDGNRFAALVTDRIRLDDVPERLAALGRPGGGAGGITIIVP